MSSHSDTLKLAVQHQQAGRNAEAEQLVRQILAADPHHALAHAHLGVLRHQAGDLLHAEHSFREVVRITPADAQAHANLARALFDLGRLAEAEASYRQAARLAPRVARNHFSLGTVLQAQGKVQAASDCYQQALQLAPDQAETHNNLGIVLRELGHYRQAEAHYRRATQLQGNFAAAFNNLGVVLSDQGRQSEAVAAFARAIELAPEFSQAFSNLSGSLENLGRVDEGIDAASRAIALDPGLAPAYCNLGMCLQARGQVDEAVRAYRAGLQAAPHDYQQHSNLVYALNYLPGISMQAVFDEHRDWGRLHADPLTATAPPHDNERSAARRLRVGYVSAHFRNHAVAVFVEPILAAHDRGAVEVYCYSNSPVSDEATARFQQYAEQWRSIAALSDEDACALIRRDQIDILMDLSGHITGNRLRLFARKPAPVQVTYIGYQNTTGMLAMDYRLTDAHADPLGTSDAYYTERLLRLPETFFCYRPEPAAPPVAPLPALARGQVTFGSFNHFSKITPQVLATWAECLRAVPDSRMLILAPDTPWMRAYLARSFERAGVDPARIGLAPRRPYPDYLRLLGEVDLALDSFPFNGHTTTCDCLWQGVPVVTLAGDRYASRFGSTAHVHLDLHDLIAGDPAEYVAVAARLARDRTRLGQLRAELRPRMAASALVDGERFARNLEASYRDMWQHWCETGK